jgi:hypothetical protein
MTRSLVLAFGVVLCACAIQPPRIVGPYAARFSEQDLQEIARVIAQHPNIDPDIISIVAVGPETLQVETAHQWARYAPQTYFTVVRRHGRWIIDESSIKRIDWIEGS